MLSAISPAGTTPMPMPIAPSSGNAAGGGSPFAALIDRAISNVNESRGASEAAIHDLATGRTDNLHEVMLKVAQADLSFRLVLEIRNRLTDAYQEVMKMQI